MLEAPKGPLYPILPLRDIVVFPHMIVPLFVGREKSVRALEDVMKEDKQILLVAQKNAAQDDPTVNDIFSVGTIGTVLQLLKLPDGTVKVLVEGNQRARISKFTDNELFFQAAAEPMQDRAGDPQEHEALARTVITQFEQYIKLNKKIPPEVLVSINQIEDPSKLADTVASHLQLKIPEKQELLELEGVSERLERVYAFMEVLLQSYVSGEDQFFQSDVAKGSSKCASGCPAGPIAPFYMSAPQAYSGFGPSKAASTDLGSGNELAALQLRWPE